MKTFRADEKTDAFEVFVMEAKQRTLAEVPTVAIPLFPVLE